MIACIDLSMSLDDVLSNTCSSLAIPGSGWNENDIKKHVLYVILMGQFLNPWFIIG
jgi:hypothetical protein